MQSHSHRVSCSGRYNSNLGPPSLADVSSFNIFVQYFDAKIRMVTCINGVCDNPTKPMTDVRHQTSWLCKLTYNVIQCNHHITLLLYCSLCVPSYGVNQTVPLYTCCAILLSGRDSARPKVVAAPQGPPGMFVEGDWACGSCGNMNWQKRKDCNLCSAPKPGMDFRLCKTDSF